VIAGRLKVRGLEPSVREAAEWCLAVADHYGVDVTVVSGARNRSEQTRLYNNYQQCLRSGRFGRTKDCLYPANPPGESAHEFRLAWDSSVAPELMSWWTMVRRAAGFHVLENDLPHAEAPNWRAYVGLSA
jgi:D-alanyl-D-alanine carboxypeptidase-like protein